MNTLYLKIETRQASHLPTWLREVPPEVPPYAEWRAMQEAPEVRPVEEQSYPKSCKKRETIERKQKEAYDKAVASAARWEEELPDRYQEVLDRRAELLASMREGTALSALAGGEIACVGLLGSDEPDAEIVRGDTERRTLGRLSMHLQRIMGRDTQVCAWTGFSFEYAFIARRAAYHAVRAEDPRVRSALVRLAKSFHHDVAWRAPKHLTEVRSAWKFGDNRPKGSLAEVASFLAFDVPEWWYECDPETLSANGDAVSQDCRCITSLHMLRHVREQCLALGWLR